ncbi:DNA gyrase subunit A [Patescibacteria group bacterium]|nr:DNA gyrase subunit A [Patescibacteria group bacterium]MBU1663574.1 DNA gyrase subunit A [Patescibacteria group bacterium]MBU1934039.1 DNA gyrase subunit A [Patescibacteria group bacterium]MBU2007979.1 DNA gyrase subunit A [Patescibacteria group bacterium]MBU2264113.1 DNA gyrase subunit A [Patescibacteria group bacterium]
MHKKILKPFLSKASKDKKKNKAGKTRLNPRLSGELKAVTPPEPSLIKGKNETVALKNAESEAKNGTGSIANLTVTKKEKTFYGIVEPQPINDEMRKSYLDYAMSVIVSRALPDVRDGLKPVHRRILYAMWNVGLRANARFRKSATVVGEVLGKYHPHGDTAVYDSMVRMAQDFSMRYQLVRGQGNFGSMDGDRAAAMRYTEAKLSAIAEELLFDIEKNTVNFIPNFDGSHQEPLVMPAKLPNLLLNGAMGIAVGMATNIPPHNLKELINAISHLISNPEATVEDLMQFVKGPDFPTGGVIYNQKDILQAYATGKGGIVMRGVAEVVENKNGLFQIIISQIPYQINKSTLVEKIAELVKDKKIEGIKDLRDESDKDGVRIAVDLKKDAYPKKILNSLFKMTQLQETFHVNMLALVDGIQPKVLTLKMVLEEYIKHRAEVVKRRTQFDLDKALERAHILEGLMIALNNIDAVIKIIKASRDKEAAKVNLMKKFKLSERQTIAILDMKLSTLANLERLKIENELKEKRVLIKELESILKSTFKIKDIIKKEINDLAEKFGDDRRTKVIAHGVKEFLTEDLVPNEEAVVMMTRDGYIKRTAPDTFKVQGRGGKGVIGLTTKEEDMVEFMFTTLTHNDLLFFTTKGRVFQLKAYEIPQATRTAKGMPIVNFLQLAGGEKITSVLPLDKIAKSKYLFFATEKGLVKKVEIDAFSNVRRSGLIAIKIREDDSLIWAKPTDGNDHIELVTAHGQAIRFKESDVRDMGRNAAGVRGIRLKKKDDTVVGMGVIKNDKEKIKKYQLLAISEHGFGKRTPIGLYKVHGRGGFGIKTAKITSKTGKLISAFVVNAEIMADKDMIIISEKGQVIRLTFKTVSQSGRDTQGVRLMRFKEDSDKVACVTWV